MKELFDLVENIPIDIVITFSYMSRKRGGELNINRVSFEVEHLMSGNQYRHIIWW